jgi:drug/metabolite transporter (DMT)-like permease
MTRFKDMQKAGIAIMVLSTFFFAFKPILVRVALDEGIDPEGLLVLRLAVAFPLFLVTVALFRRFGELRMGARDFLFISIVSVFGMGGAMLFSFYAIKYLGASISTLVIFVFPAITALLSSLAFGETISTRKRISLAVSFTGIALVVLPLTNGADVGNIEGFDPVKGFVVAMVCAVCWSGTQVAFQKFLEKRSPLPTALITSGVMLIFFTAMTGIPSLDITTKGLWAIVLLGTLGWYVPFLLAMYALKIIGASRSAIIQSLGPGLTVAIAGYILGERLMAVQFGGMFLVIYAVYMIRDEKAEVEIDVVADTVAEVSPDPEPAPEEA